MRKILTLLFLCGVPAAGANITVNPSATYQTWHYWMSILSAAPAVVGNAEPSLSPAWNTSLKQAMLGQIVNQLGLNTVQLTVSSGTIENNVMPDGIHDCWTYFNLVNVSNAGWATCRYLPVNDDADPNHFGCADPTLVNCPGSFPFGSMDYTLDNYVVGPTGLKALVNANGEAFHINFQWIHWPSAITFVDTSGAEAGEHILAAFMHIRNKYGTQYVPDILDMMVEPDAHCLSENLPAGDCAQEGTWDFKKLGAAMNGIQTRLAAAGFHPQIWCCSTISSGTAVDWYTNVKAQSPSVTGALTTHWYDGPDTTHLAANAARAAADGVPVVMTEWTGLGIDAIYSLITAGNVSGVEKYGMALVGSVDSPSSLLTVTSAAPYASRYVSSSTGPSYVYYFPQLWHYVRDNDVREQATSSDPAFLPIAFRSPAGLDKVVVLVHTTGNQTVNVSGVNAGTYGCTYTYSNAVLLNPCGANQTIGAGGTLVANLPAIPAGPAGSLTMAVVTFYGIPSPTAPVIYANGIVPVDSPVPTIQPGSWISIYGNNLAPSTSAWNGNFPTNLNGVSVTVNGKAGYLWLVSPNQINLQAPDDTASGPVTVVVTTPNGSTSATVTLASIAPSFTLLDATHPAGAILTPDGSGAYANGTYDLLGPSGQFGFSTRPVKVGETIELFGVGFGPTTSPVPAGQAFSGAASTVNPVSISIGGVPANVQYAGIVSPGLYQFNVVVPAVPSGSQLLQATVGGVMAPTPAYITVQ